MFLHGGVSRGTRPNNGWMECPLSHSWNDDEKRMNGCGAAGADCVNKYYHLVSGFGLVKGNGNSSIWSFRIIWSLFFFASQQNVQDKKNNFYHHHYPSSSICFLHRKDNKQHIRLFPWLLPRPPPFFDSQSLIRSFSILILSDHRSSSSFISVSDLLVRRGFSFDNNNNNTNNIFTSNCCCIIQLLVFVSSTTPKTSSSCAINFYYPRLPLLHRRHHPIDHPMDEILASWSTNNTTSSTSSHSPPVPCNGPTQCNYWNGRVLLQCAAVCEWEEDDEPID